MGNDRRGCKGNISLADRFCHVSCRKRAFCETHAYERLRSGMSERHKCVKSALHWRIFVCIDLHSSPLQYHRNARIPCTSFFHVNKCSFEKFLLSLKRLHKLEKKLPYILKNSIHPSPVFHWTSGKNHCIRNLKTLCHLLYLNNFTNNCSDPVTIVCP